MQATILFLNRVGYPGVFTLGLCIDSDNKDMYICMYTRLYMHIYMYIH